MNTPFGMDEAIESGRLVTPEMSATYRALIKMTEGQRGAILCWFCSSCRKHIGPFEPQCECETTNGAPKER